MTLALATTYKANHIATIRADMAAKRAAAQAELPGKLIPYPRHVPTAAVGYKTVQTGNAPDWVYEKVAVNMGRVDAPNAPGITVTIDCTDYTGGRDENGERVDDGHGAVINITTAEGTLEVREGYHRAGNADAWRPV